MSFRAPHFVESDVTQAALPLYLYLGPDSSPQGTYELMGVSIARLRRDSADDWFMSKGRLPLQALAHGMLSGHGKALAVFWALLLEFGFQVLGGAFSLSPIF